MALCCGSENVSPEDLASLYGSLGRTADAFDNMFYERMGISCEDMISMLKNPDIKI